MSGVALVIPEIRQKKDNNTVKNVQMVNIHSFLIFIALIDIKRTHSIINIFLEFTSLEHKFLQIVHNLGFKNPAPESQNFKRNLARTLLWICNIGSDPARSVA